MNQFNVGNEILDILKHTSSHAFSNVILWVVISYFFFELLNYFSKNGFSKIIKRNKNIQPLIGAMMGSIPGSGATLFLLPLYKKKEISFASLTAAFISTMGEVAFILIAQQPILYLWMVLFSFIVAIIVGYGLHFLKIEKKFNLSDHLEKDIEKEFKQCDCKDKKNINHPIVKIVMEIIVPTIFFITWIMSLPFFIIDIIEVNHTYAPGHNHSSPFILGLEWLFFISSIVMILAFILKKTIFKKCEKHKNVHFHKFNNKENIKNIKHIIHDTFENSLFIFIWVFVAMLMVEVPFRFIPSLPSNASNMFDDIGFVIGMIFLGGIVSILPGCGPNLIFTSWFLSIATNAPTGWTLPFAIMISNSMAQDGDSGFPLLALNRKTYFAMKGINIIIGIIFGLIFIPLTDVLPGLII